MNVLRPLLILAVVVGACFLSTAYSEHHSGSNEDAFNFLYGHVTPAVLVLGGHDEGPETGTGIDAEPGAHGGHDEAAGEEAAHAAPVENPLLAITLPRALQSFDGDRDLENGVQLVLYNLQIFQVAAVLLILLAFSGVPRYLRTGEGDAISRLFAGMCVAIRDEMVRPAIGERDGDRFLPFFLSLFFFILFMNVMGLVPGSATATASIFVTAAMALITLLAMLGCGMAAQGPVAYWKNLVPHVPGWLWPLMFFVEVIGVFIKPFALMIRLFANMTGGHLVVLSLMGLIFFFAGVEFSKIGYAVSPVVVAFGVFIMIIEGFVALLQAYIFTQLSIIFVGASIHPQH